MDPTERAPRLNTAEAAELLGVTERRVQQMAKSGVLHPIGTEYRDAKGKPGLLFEHEEVAEVECSRRRDGGRLARLAAQWRGGA